LFLCAGAVVHATGMTKLSEMGGLARRRPLVTAAFLVGTLAIAGVPPLNGYVSLGLIHGSVEHGHPVTFAVLTLAQALTVAALARALYLEFFRRREDDYDRIERLSPGMLTAFGLLAGGCVLFGAAPTVILDRVIQPSAASLTSGAQYAAAVLGGGGPLTVPAADFSYLQPTQLGVLAGTLIVGLGLAGWAVRRPAVADRPPLSWLRALHTGSVNDYAGYSALGILACITVLLLPVLVA